MKYPRGEILCRRLEWERGTVSGRVALLLRSAEVKPLFYRFVRLSKSWASSLFFIVMPRASGPVPFELGVCAGHVVRIGLRTQNYRKSQGKGRGKKMRNRQRAAKGQKMRSQRTKKNRKSQGKRAKSRMNAWGSKMQSKGGAAVLESACSRMGLGQARRGLCRLLFDREKSIGETQKKRSRRRNGQGRKVYWMGAKKRSRQGNGQGKVYWMVAKKRSRQGNGQGKVYWMVAKTRGQPTRKRLGKSIFESAGNDV